MRNPRPEPGDEIVIRGHSFVIEKVTSAQDYGNTGEPDWYMEFYDTNGDFHYIKQKYDGVKIYTRNEQKDRVIKKLALLGLEYLDEDLVQRHMRMSDKELNDLYYALRKELK